MMRLLKVWSSAILATMIIAAAAFGQEDTTSVNKIWVADASGAAGGFSTLKVRADSDTDIYAIQFDLLFDQTTLQISSNGVSLGNDAMSLGIPVIDDDAIASANTSGKLVVYMLDLNSDPNSDLGKLSAGTNKELLSVKFSVSEDAALGDLTIGLANVSMVNVSQDTVTTEVEFMAEDGTLTISEFAPGDVSGDGVVNVFDVLDLLKALKGTPTTGPSDLNGDGVTNIFDVLELLRML
jgi:hypothetical protein